ncbi:MAG: hypothetical protein LBC70_09740 [Chitinispirillales bacterium]|nr:hypothetical protein [Chitinispirillales bacterium]
MLESKTRSGRTEKFEYDNKNRIVKTSSGREFRTITYNRDGSVEIARYNFDKSERLATSHFYRDGNTITVLDNSQIPETLTVNEDGYIVSSERSTDWMSVKTYQYQDGNLIKLTDASRQVSSNTEHLHIVEFEYDDKKSPFLNCNTPGWLLQYLAGSVSTDLGLKNNIIEVRSDVRGAELTTFKYEYEYDGDGFPTKQTMRVSHEYGTDEEITFFTYRGEADTVNHDTHYTPDDDNKDDTEPTAASAYLTTMFMRRDMNMIRQVTWPPKSGKTA